jgi:hypothetical protein
MIFREEKPEDSAGIRAGLLALAVSLKFLMKLLWSWNFVKMLYAGVAGL